MLALVLMGGLSFLVLRPLVGGAASSGEEADAPRSERDMLRSALLDLEHDFETGKLSAEDRERLRQDLAREAARALERAAPPLAKPGGTTCACGHAFAPDQHFCAKCGWRVLCECGHQPQADDRFCAGCGRNL